MNAYIGPIIPTWQYVYVGAHISPKEYGKAQKKDTRRKFKFLGKK